MDEQGARSGEAAEIRILFGSRRDAERRIAGVCALARIAREFEAAAVPAVSVVIGDATDLSASCRQDLLRVAGGIRVDVLAGGAAAAPAVPCGAEVIVFSGEHLLSGEAVRRFLAGREPFLVWHGRAVARRILSGILPRSPQQLLSFAGQPDNVAADEVVPLSSPAAAARELLRRTGKESDGPVARWLNRPISRGISALCLLLPWLRPNHVTCVTAAIAGAMLGCFFFGDRTAILVGGLLFHLASVIDGVDGEMARVSFRASVGGAMFDMIVDRLTILAFFLGITVAMARTEGMHHALVGGWGFAAAVIGVLILSRVLRRIEPPRTYDVMTKIVRRRWSKPPAKWIVELMALLIGRDVFSFVFPLMMVLGAASAVTWVFTGFTTFWLGLVLATAPVILRGGTRPLGSSGSGEEGRQGAPGAASRAA